MVAGDGEHVQAYCSVDRDPSDTGRAKGTAALDQMPSAIIAVVLAVSFSSVGPIAFLPQGEPAMQVKAA